MKSNEKIKPATLVPNSKHFKKPYKDNSLHVSSDLTLHLQFSNGQNLTHEESRNEGERLRVNGSTRLEIQPSIATNNQFSLTNNFVRQNSNDSKDRSKKISSSLVEEFKGREIIEEEKQDPSDQPNRGPKITGRLYHGDSSDEEEEKKMPVLQISNRLMNKDSIRKTGNTATKVEKLTTIKSKFDSRVPSVDPFNGSQVSVRNIQRDEENKSQVSSDRSRRSNSWVLRNRDEELVVVEQQHLDNDQEV